MEFKVSNGVIPTNKSSKYDDVVEAIKNLGTGEHLEIKATDEDKAEKLNNAIRSAAKSRGMSLTITKREGVLYIRAKS